MKHLSKGRKLGRVRKQRKALMKTLLGSLILHGKIRTTEARAKEIKGAVDKIVNKAKQAKVENKKVAAVRDLKNKIPPVAVKKMTSDFIERFSARGSGYSRIIKLAARKSDGARMAIIEFVD